MRGFAAVLTTLICALVVALGLSLWFVHAEHHDARSLEQRRIENCQVAAVNSDTSDFARECLDAELHRDLKRQYAPTTTTAPK